MVANGDVKSESDITRTVTYTGVNGVMAARGILQNPAMFGGYGEVPLHCIEDWVDISLSSGLTFTSFHHHLMHMLERVQARTERRVFNTLSSTPAVLEFLNDHYGIKFR